MTVREMIMELRRLGYKVEARKRTDGGYLITKINGQTYSAAKGNTYARNVLGVDLPPARAEQLKYNVDKYIKLKPGQRKATEKVKIELRDKLKDVQKLWRKSRMKGKITMPKLRGYIKEQGEEGANKYLDRMKHHGEGYAYEEEVEYLAQYIERTAKGRGIKEDYKDLILKAAEKVRSLKNVFKEEWVYPTYEKWYAVIEHHYDPQIIYQAVMATVTLG